MIRRKSPKCNKSLGIHNLFPSSQLNCLLLRFYDDFCRDPQTFQSLVNYLHQTVISSRGPCFHDHAHCAGYLSTHVIQRAALDARANRDIIYRGAWGYQGASFVWAFGRDFTTGRESGRYNGRSGSVIWGCRGRVVMARVGLNTVTCGRSRLQ